MNNIIEGSGELIKGFGAEFYLSILLIVSIPVLLIVPFYSLFLSIAGKNISSSV
jgi:hypothetical protein